MKYEIINPSDKCYIYADNEKLAKIACALLGNQWYGLKDENGEMILGILENINDALGMTDNDIEKFIYDNATELSDIFSSFEYADERTSLNNIGGRAELYAKSLSEKALEAAK